MSTRIAINGFGRIGRLVFRALFEQGLLGKELDVVAVNDLVPADNLAYLLKYDSTQGRFKGSVEREEVRPDAAEGRRAGRRRPRDQVPRREEGPAELPWKELGVDYVIESTGLFTDAEKAKGHITAGAKKVIISAPAKDEDITVVMGVNHEKYDAGKHNIISQRQLHDQLPRPGRPRAAEGRLRHRRRPDDDDPQLHRDAEDGGRPVARRTGRAAARRPSTSSRRTTGAAKAVGAGDARSEGQADRHVVPRADADRLGRRPDRARPSKETSYKEICAAMKKASETYLKGILGYTDDEVVSSDFIHDDRSRASSTPAAASS